MKIIRILLFALPLIAGLLLGACSEDNPIDPRNVTVTVTPDVAQLFTGDTITLKASVTGASDTTVVWSVSFADTDDGHLLPDGRYIAPDTVTGDIAVIIIRATSNAEPLARSEAVITIRNRVAQTTLIRPGVGSGYIFTTRELDSLKRVVPGSEKTETYTVIRTNAQLNGRSDVTVLLSGGTEFPVIYEYNGDVSLLGDRGWLTYPFGSKSSVVLEQYDTTFGGLGSFSVVSTATYAGSEVITIAGHALTVHKVVVSTSTTGAAISVNTTSQYWFAPSIGWFSRFENWITGTSGVVSTSGYESVLQSYTLK